MMLKFFPTIYEHSAALVGATPSAAAYDYDLLVRGQIRAYELYSHDLITVGIDIYNVEAEALGLTVTRYDNNTLPSIEGILLEDLKQIEDLKKPNPNRDGRMPMFLAAAEEISSKTNAAVNGCITGPYTLAAILRGYENLIIDFYTNPNEVERLLEFTYDVCIEYGKAYIDMGLGLSVNESWIAPPLLNPGMYRKYVKNLHKNMIAEFKEHGAKSVGLICGGNTQEIAADLVDTGTSLIMADHMTDHAVIKEICRKNNVILRASIDAALVQAGDEYKLRAASQKVIEMCSDYDKFVFGCGIVPYETPPENVLMLKRIVNEISQSTQTKQG
jgi:uroporphyrinogen decarboxylase